MSRLRVPDQDGAHLIDPPLSALQPRLVVLGRPELQELRRLARAEVLAAARHYLAEFGEPLPEQTGDLIFLAGHQPELFHPGVWLKNFVLHRLGRTQRAHTINLLVDNDVAKTTSLIVPVVGGVRPRAVPVSMDQLAPGLPYEEWEVRDEEFFANVPDRIGYAASGTNSLLVPFWEEICRQSSRTKNVPERFAAARRGFERRWGCHNLELPVSRLCGTASFGRFMAQLLSELPRFHDVFNAAVRAYRRKHHLKSRHHPFPELVRDGDWLEAPFWAWEPGSPVRQRLFARRTADGVVLRPGNEPSLKIRPRAITLTLFARLFVGDLFLHGIGGAKYDEVTDEVMRGFHGVEPPPIVAVSGTLRLPLPTYPTTSGDVRRLERLLRDLEFNPQRHLPVDELVAHRGEWVARKPQDDAGRRARFHAIRRLNAQLGERLETRRREVEEELSRRREELRANVVLRRRDWAFCLFPEETLRKFLTSLR